jgi:ribosomal protein uS17
MADEEKDETEVSDTTPTNEETPAPEEVSDTTPATADADATAGEEVSDTAAAAESAPAAEEVSDTAAAAESAPAAEEVSDTAAAAESAPAAEEVSDTSVPAADHDVSDPGITLAAKKQRSGKHVPRSQGRTRSKPVREKPATRKPITRTEKPVSELGRRQERRGVVVSDKGDKTIVVKVDVIKSHPKYKKVIRRAVKFHAHDEANTAGVGDTVRIVETRPLSKAKRWRLAEIVEKAR